MADASSLRVDLHTHTSFSPDAVIRPADLVERAYAAGLDKVAVTDHGTIEGALRAREIAPQLVIIGEEIRCSCGTELIGLFLEERIPMRLDLAEVVERIRDQRGVVYAPHPYAYPRNPFARAARALAVAEVVEVVNARAFLPLWNRAAARAARQRGLAAGAGSDAHFPGEVGRAYLLAPAFEGADSFRRAITAARPVWKATTGPHMHVASWALKLGRAVSEWRAAGPLAAPGTLPAE